MTSEKQKKLILNMYLQVSIPSLIVLINPSSPVLWMATLMPFMQVTGFMNSWWNSMEQRIWRSTKRVEE